MLTYQFLFFISEFVFEISRDFLTSDLKAAEASEYIFVTKPTSTSNCDYKLLFANNYLSDMEQGSRIRMM